MSDTQPVTNSVVPKACQNCRLRKIRCDRHSPCSNCVTSCIPCQPRSRSTAVQHQQNQRERVACNRQIKTLQEKLMAAEEIIRNHATYEGQAQKQTSSIEEGCSEDFTSQAPLGFRSGSFEGESSFGSQILLASQISELTTARTGNSPGVVEGLASLKGLLDNDERLHVSKSHLNNQISDMELVPSNFVLQLLRTVRGNESLLFLLYRIHDRTQFEELCRRVYFPCEPLSIGELTLFNGMVSILIKDLALYQHNAFNPDDIAHYGRICEKNFRAGLETFEITGVPTYTNILALSIAAINAQKSGELSLQWTWTSVAARHCLALGYHREKRVKQFSDPDKIRRLFWQIYTSDKNLCLRLGRTPSIQDYDIDLEPNTVSQDPGCAPWDYASIKFVEFSRIQARIYEMLYSASAKKLNTAERQEKVKDLLPKLTQWYDAWKRMDASNAYHRVYFECTYGPTTVIYFSVLTLLHLGSTSPGSTIDISNECFETARQGLRAHLSYYGKLENGDVDALAAYVNWVFYYSSFTPFIVTFIHCIKYSNDEDLKLLKSVLETLDHLEASVQHGKSQQNLCSALYKVAEAFTNAHSTVTGPEAEGLERTLVSPFQQPLSEIWDYLDPSLAGSLQLRNIHMEDWGNTWLGHVSQGLENGLR